MKYQPLAGIHAYRAALQERTRERVPLDWASTQNNLGNALATLGERESGTTRFEEAVGAYRAALGEWTRERVPLDWATAQNNLGNALFRVGERESGTARLEDAVVAYREALEERTRERVPLYWASSLSNLGVAMSVLADRTNDGALAETAFQQIQTAYETLRSGGQEQWAAQLEAQLPKAQAVRDRLKGKSAVLVVQRLAGEVGDASAGGGPGKPKPAAVPDTVRTLPKFLLPTSAVRANNPFFLCSACSASLLKCQAITKTYLLRLRKTSPTRSPSHCVSRSRGHSQC